VSVAVRQARAEDAPILLSLIRDLASYEMLTPPDGGAQQRLVADIFGERPRLWAWLAESDGAAIGYALALETYSSFLARPTMFLEDLFVSPAHRLTGAGRALFLAVAEEARARGCGRMEWVVLDWNELAQGFYGRLGASRQGNWQYWRLTREELDRL
jgi:GNAT superfamily N-acetyltransferase